MIPVTWIHALAGTDVDPITHSAAITSESVCWEAVTEYQRPCDSNNSSRDGSESTIKVLEARFLSSEGSKDLLRVGGLDLGGFRHHQPCVGLQNHHPVPDFIFR